MSRHEAKSKAAIWLQTWGITGAHILATWLVYKIIFYKAFGMRAFPLAVAFLFIQTIALALLLTWLLIAKAMDMLRGHRGERLYPVITKYLAAQAVGDDARRALRRLHGKYPGEFEPCILQLLQSFSGDGCDRLSALAVELGLVTKWEGQYRSRHAERRRQALVKLGLLTGGAGHDILVRALSDEQEANRAAAFRALIRSAGTEEVERLFDFVLTQPLLIRAILAEDLKPHALTLARCAIPAALAAPDPVQVARALELVASWRRVLPLPQLLTLLRSPHPQIVENTLRVLPYVCVEAEAGPEILAALTSADDRIRAAAARAAAEMGAKTAVPALAGCLRANNPEVALAASYALAELGVPGVQMLESEIISALPAASAVALEALEHARLRL